MQNRTDAELLRDFADDRSEAAFNEIVRRYADAVYSAALRQVGNEHQARDVAQTVFVDLARKAGSLKPNTLLIGWLHRSARFAAMELLRTEQRRFNREQQAMELHNPSSETEGDWAAIRPVLDEAIANLGDEDRNALLLRFFKNESLSSVGATLGVSEDAAQKRVSRALDKLRDFLAQRGIKTTAAALSISLAANTIHSAPSGFAPTLAASCLSLTKTAVSTSSGLNLFTFFNLKTTLLSMLIVGGLGVLFIANVRSQRELSDTRKLYDLQSGEIHGLRTEIQQLTSQTNELNRLRNDAREVLRLRNQVTQLRRELAERNALVSTLKQRASDGDLAAPSPSQMNIKAKFISIPSTSFQGGITGTLTSPQLELVLQSLNINEATNLISEGQITLLDQRQGQIQIQGTNGYIISLEVTPTWRKTTGTINLDYRIVSALVADSPRNSLPPGADLPLVEAQEMTNNVNIPDGHTLMASRSMSERESLLLNSKQPGPRTLLILLTPTAIDSVGNRFEVLPKIRTSGLNRKHTGNDTAKTKQTDAPEIFRRL